MNVLQRFYESIAPSFSRGQEIHVSDIVYDCLRRCYYQILFRDPKKIRDLDIHTMIRFWIGSAIDSQRILEKQHVRLTWKEIHGEVDEYENGIVLEKKHTSYFMKELPYQYKRQVEYYCPMLYYNNFPVKEVHILLINVSAAEAFDFLIRIRPIEDIAAEMLFKRDIIKYSLKTENPPPYTVGVDCKFCKAASECMRARNV